MTKISPRVTARKPYVPPKLTYFGQMNEIVMASEGNGKFTPSKETPSTGGGSIFRGWKDSY